MSIFEYDEEKEIEKIRKAEQVVDLIAENPEATDAQIVVKFQND